MTNPTYPDDLALWRARRLAALCAEDGWLNLTDRVDLRQGAQTVGSGENADVRLSVGPEMLGVLTLGPDGAARLDLPQGAGSVAFAPVRDAFPRADVGALILEIHTVDGVPALRVRDRNSVARGSFAGLRHFPTDPAWCIRAGWERLATPQARDIAMKGGQGATVEVTHRAVFDWQGQHVTLLPTHAKNGKPQFVFRDATARDATYGAGRFLFGEDIGDGRITLDFNKAFNPPCAFSDLAICPLPPPENVLPFRIEAGELRP